jgi:hypothetical protein
VKSYHSTTRNYKGLRFEEHACHAEDLNRIKQYYFAYPAHENLLTENFILIGVWLFFLT